MIEYQLLFYWSIYTYPSSAATRRKNWASRARPTYEHCYPVLGRGPDKYGRTKMRNWRRKHMNDCYLPLGAGTNDSFTDNWLAFSYLIWNCTCIILSIMYSEEQNKSLTTTTTTHSNCSRLTKSNPVFHASNFTTKERRKIKVKKTTIL